MLLPLTVSCFSEIQIGFTFLVLAHLGSPGKKPLNGCCFCCQFIDDISANWLNWPTGYPVNSLPATYGSVKYGTGTQRVDWSRPRATKKTQQSGNTIRQDGTTSIRNSLAVCNLQRRQPTTCRPLHRHLSESLSCFYEQLPSPGSPTFLLIPFRSQ